MNLSSRERGGGIEGLREKKKTYEGSSQSLKSFGNLDSQMVLDERPLRPNGTTRGQVDPAQVRGWNLATNDVPILERLGETIRQDFLLR